MFARSPAGERGGGASNVEQRLHLAAARGTAGGDSREGGEKKGGKNIKIKESRSSLGGQNRFKKKFKKKRGEGEEEGENED